jgi:hypothetical protein
VFQCLRSVLCISVLAMHLRVSVSSAVFQSLVMSCVSVFEYPVLVFEKCSVFQCLSSVLCVSVAVVSVVSLCISVLCVSTAEVSCVSIVLYVNVAVVSVVSCVAVLFRVSVLQYCLCQGVVLQ